VEGPEEPPVSGLARSLRGLFDAVRPAGHGGEERESRRRAGDVRARFTTRVARYLATGRPEAARSDLVAMIRSFQEEGDEPPLLDAALALARVEKDPVLQALLVRPETALGVVRRLAGGGVTEHDRLAHLMRLYPGNMAPAAAEALVGEGEEETRQVIRVCLAAAGVDPALIPREWRGILDELLEG
jgi:hypothetical protein